LTIGARPACTISCAPPSMLRSTACLLPSASIMSTGDAAFLLAAAGEVVHAAERQHLRAVFGVVTWPTTSPLQRTLACSGPSQRSVSIFTFSCSS
jgi:hypothetical protein